MELTLAIFTLIFSLCNAALSENNATKLIKPLPCGATIKCSYVEDPVWVTDGKSCFVFRNSCILSIENCRRERNNQKKLEVIPKEKCQSLCYSKCPKFDPVCGYYNGNLIDFPSLCWMEFYVCKTGEIYEVNNEGVCQP